MNPRITVYKRQKIPESEQANHAGFKEDKRFGNPKKGFQRPHKKIVSSKMLKKKTTHCTYIESMLLTFVSRTQISAIYEPWDLVNVV